MLGAAPTSTPDLVEVPPGIVTLSDRRTRRRWSVEVAPFLLGRVPVTQALYVDVTGERPGAVVDDQLPAENVSWIDAARFCNALSEQHGLAVAYRFGETRAGGGQDRADGREAPEDGGEVEAVPSANGYRLPTEAEWEHACRAGDDGPRYGVLDDIAWYRYNADERVRPVGLKQPNAWGLYDLLGNVWEWCWDVYDAEVYGPYRVLRGGGWFDPHWSCRASVRRRSHPTLRLDDVGFRLARTVDPDHTPDRG